MSGKGLGVAMLAVATILAVAAAGKDEKNEVGGQLGNESREFNHQCSDRGRAGRLDVKVWRRLSKLGGIWDFWAGQPDFPPPPTGKTRQHNFLVSSGAFLALPATVLLP